MTTVCYISPISIHSVRYLEAFKRKGYNVSIIADSQTWVAPKIQSIPTYFIPQLTRFNFHKRSISNTYIITRILKTIKPDLVHLHAHYHYSPAIMLTRTPFILTSWGSEILALQNANPLIKMLAKTGAWKASKLTVDANLLKRIWIQIGIPSNKVQVIPFGVDMKVFNPSVEGSAIRKKLGIKDSEIAVISTRTLRNRHYNVESFIRAMPLIQESCNNVKFIVKGKGPLEDSLRKLAKKLQISEKVSFVGIVPHAEMAKYLAASDVYVSTCYKDTTSVSLLEAMACGTAPVVTDIAGNREWITDGENGLLFPPEDHAALAKQVIQLARDESLRRRFGQKCHEKVKHRASWEDCIAKMEHIYQTAMQLGA